MSSMLLRSAPFDSRFFVSTKGFCALLGALLVGGATAQGHIPSLYYQFEEDGQPGVQVDLSRDAFQIPFSKGSERVSDIARFGSGSLKMDRISEESETGRAFEALLNKPDLEGFRDEITQLTISAWVQPSGVKPFVIFRRIPGSTNLPGYFQFTSLGGEKTRLYFSMCGEGEGEAASAQAMSGNVVSLLPGEWNHVAMTFDEGTLRFYVNGRVAGDPVVLSHKSIPPVTERFSSLLAVAGMEEGSYLDDFALIGDRALDEQAISSLYESGLEAFLNESQ